jgi:large subunit ribosomal protein L4
MLRSLLCVAACLGASGLQAGAALRGVGVQRAAAPQMVGVPLANFDGEKVGAKPVELKVAKSGAYIVQRKVVAEQANMRLGTAKTKTRTEVRGGGRKPYKQKGTGRARQGSIRTPLRRGGGVLFGPRGVGKARYSIRMNKKEKQLAISTALMGSTSKMTIVEDFEEKFATPATKTMKGFLDRLEVDTTNRESTLMIYQKSHENTYLSARNIPYLNLIPLDNLNARDIVRAKKVVVSTGALSVLQARYGDAAEA